MWQGALCHVYECTYVYVEVYYVNTSNAVYRQTSNKTHIFVGKGIVDHSDVVGASPIGAAPTTSSFLT